MFRKLLFAAAIALVAGASQASQITALSAVGTWSVVSKVGSPRITGNGTDTIRWGESFPGYNGRSGFAFDAVNMGKSFDVNKAFDVGVFTHMNRVIYQGEHVDVARLNLKFTASFDGMVRTFNTSYNFSLWETPNLANPCANGGQNGIRPDYSRKSGFGGSLNSNGCADRVRLLKNDALSDSFTHNGKIYSFSLFGFDSGSEFWTVEDRDNSTFLNAVFNVRDVPTTRTPPRTPRNTPPNAPPPPPPVIPLPAGVWLLLGALGGLGAVRRFGLRR